MTGRADVSHPRSQRRRAHTRSPAASSRYLVTGWRGEAALGGGMSGTDRTVRVFLSTPCFRSLALAHPGELLERVAPFRRVATADREGERHLADVEVAVAVDGQA